MHASSRWSRLPRVASCSRDVAPPDLCPLSSRGLSHPGVRRPVHNMSMAIRLRCPSESHCVSVVSTTLFHGVTCGEQFERSLGKAVDLGKSSQRKRQFITTSIASFSKYLLRSLMLTAFLSEYHCGLGITSL